MKAILTYSVSEEDKVIKQTRLFDTDTAIKICDIKNDFDVAVQEIYITSKGILFLQNMNGDKPVSLKVPDQEQIKAWIGEHEPDEYIYRFGEVEDA